MRSNVLALVAWPIDDLPVFVSIHTVQIVEWLCIGDENDPAIRSGWVLVVRGEESVQVGLALFASWEMNVADGDSHFAVIQQF